MKPAESNGTAHLDDERDPQPGALHPAALVLRANPNLYDLPGPEPS